MMVKAMDVEMSSEQKMLIRQYIDHNMAINTLS